MLGERLGEVRDEEEGLGAAQVLLLELVAPEEVEERQEERQLKGKR